MAKAVRSEAPPGDDGLPAAVLVSALHTRTAQQGGGGSVAIQSLYAFLWSDRRLQRRDIVPAAIDRVRGRSTPRALKPCATPMSIAKCSLIPTAKVHIDETEIHSRPMTGRAVLITGGTGGIGRLRATASINVEDLSSFLLLAQIMLGLCSDRHSRKAFGSPSLAVGETVGLLGDRDRRPISAYTVRLVLRYPNKCLERLGRAPHCPRSDRVSQGANFWAPP